VDTKIAGRKGGQSKSPAKQQAARLNVAKARAARKTAAGAPVLFVAPTEDRPVPVRHVLFVPTAPKAEQ